MPSSVASTSGARGSGSSGSSRDCRIKITLIVFAVLGTGIIVAMVATQARPFAQFNDDSDDFYKRSYNALLNATPSLDIASTSSKMSNVTTEPVENITLSSVSNVISGDATSNSDSTDFDQLD